MVISAHADYSSIGGHSTQNSPSTMKCLEIEETVGGVMVEMAQRPTHQRSHVESNDA